MFSLLRHYRVPAFVLTILALASIAFSFQSNADSSTGDEYSGDCFIGESQQSFREDTFISFIKNGDHTHINSDYLNGAQFILYDAHDNPVKLFTLDGSESHIRIPQLPFRDGYKLVNYRMPNGVKKT